jgi:ArsR family metal-binding transcriptional regulator
MGKVVTTFPQVREFEKAKASIQALGLPCEVIEPGPGYGRVGVPALVVDEAARGALAAGGADGFTCSGWVEYRPAAIAVPCRASRAFDEDVFGTAAIMVLAPCVADETKIRLIAHISGDLTEVFPYLNAEMERASFNAAGPTFTFMEGYRMISLYPRRMALAKADEIVDAWRTLEAIRRRANEVWARRAEITPSYEMREKPPALEIFKRLPRTNCRACGEQTCLAFALRLWAGGGQPSQCKPVFGGDYRHLRPALLEICRGLGVTDSLDTPEDTSLQDTGIRR